MKDISKFMLEVRHNNRTLAEKIGVTRQTIYNWRIGKTVPDVKQLRLLSKELKCKLEDIL